MNSEAATPNTESFFISYNQHDSAWAQWIAWQLEDNGYHTIIQAWDFKPGSNFVLEMDKALEEADHVIAVLSKEYLASGFASAEWAAEFRHDPEGKYRRLVPVRIQEVACEGILSSIVYIDLVGNDEDEAREELLSQLKPGRQKPEIPPPYPGTKPQLKEKPVYPGLRRIRVDQKPANHITPAPGTPLSQIDEASKEQMKGVRRSFVRSHYFRAATYLIVVALSGIAGYFTREKLEERDRSHAEARLYESDSQLKTLRTDYEAVQTNQGDRQTVNSSARELLQQLLSISDANLSQSMQLFKYQHVCYAWGIIAGSYLEKEGMKRIDAADNMLKTCGTVESLISHEDVIHSWIGTNYAQARAERLRAVAFCIKYRIDRDSGDRDKVRDIVTRINHDFPGYVEKDRPLEKSGELQPCFQGNVTR